MTHTDFFVSMLLMYRLLEDGKVKAVAGGGYTDPLSSWMIQGLPEDTNVCTFIGICFKFIDIFLLFSFPSHSI